MHRGAGGSWAPVAEAVRSVDREELVDRCLERIWALPDWNRHAREDLVEPLRANIWFLLPIFEQRRLPNQGELRIAAGVAAIRARQGIAIEPFLRAMSICAEETWRSIKQSPGWERVEPALAQEMAELLWQMISELMCVAATQHQDALVEVERYDQEKRSNVLRSILRGSLASLDLQKASTSIGLTASEPCFVLRASPLPDVSADAIQHGLRTTVGQPADPLLCLFEGDVAGVMWTRPVDLELPVSIGVCRAEGVAAISRAFANATRCLRAATAMRAAGVFDLGSIGIRAAVSEERQLGEVFRTRYLEPLSGMGQSRDVIVSTVRSYLEQDCSIDRAARILFVHPNTVRHRLMRFTEVNGADLTSFRQRMEIWWALEDEVQSAPDEVRGAW